MMLTPLVALGDPSAQSELEAEALIREARAQRRKRRRRNMVAFVAALVVVCGLVYGLRGPLGLSSSGPASPKSATAANWHAPGSTIWKFGTASNFAGNPPTSSITCAGKAPGACYVVIEGNGVNPDGTLVDPRVVLGFAPLLSTEYRSTDLGRAWTKLTLPSGTLVTTPFSCSGAQSCAVGAIIDATDRNGPFSTGVAALLVTRDAGRSWIVHPLPRPAGEVTQLACPTASHCVALTWPSTLASINGVQPLSGANRYYPTTVMTTRNGGRTWSAARLPPVATDVYYQLGIPREDTLTCPTSTLCLATGERVLIESQGGGYIEGDVENLQMRSIDGGRSWSASSLLGPNNSIACAAGSMDCLQLGLPALPAGNPPSVWASTNAGRSWKTIHSIGIPGSSEAGITAFTCTSARDCVAGIGSNFVTTSNGGHTWVFVLRTAAPFPTNPEQQIPVVNVSSVSCLGTRGCFGVIETWTEPVSTAKVVTNEG